MTETKFVQISDDMDLRKIADSGQCFRAWGLENGWMRFVSGGSVLYIRPAEETPGQFEFLCGPGEWESVWHSYFDLDRNYARVRASVPESDPFMKEAAADGAGLRILRQDPFEMLITFIISQRKNIPAIRAAVETLAHVYGTEVSTPFETLHLFPTPGQLAGASETDLRELKLGYRAPYVADAVGRVLSGRLDLSRLAAENDKSLTESLKSVLGVGDKVADCIALFAYGRTESAPVDTWIRQVIDGEYGGIDPFPAYGENAGIMQQYVFCHAIHNKEKIRSQSAGLGRRRNTY